MLYVYENWPYNNKKRLIMQYNLFSKYANNNNPFDQRRSNQCQNLLTQVSELICFPNASTVWGKIKMEPIFELPIFQTFWLKCHGKINLQSMKKKNH